MRSFFFFNDTATTEIYSLSLHDALPISRCRRAAAPVGRANLAHARRTAHGSPGDRKSTRLNSSHVTNSYAVFCLTKKKDRSLALHNQTTHEMPESEIIY